MSRGKATVRLQLKSEISEQAERQVTEVEAIGYLYKQSGRTVLTYIEEREDQQKIANLITITPDKVSIKRSGAVEMHQQFKRDQKTENVYRHQFGTIHMETFTEEIRYLPLTVEEDGQLLMRYTTKLNGEGERHHRLLLIMKEEL
ncbi:uncharacterized beta-barrel protein YwiB (DUF1934 family) [Natronobacillus azotifigens]|uniref:DUF1934 domain-containing protein n=1 Tax=Natronobacillus azotifigens TaxID=472978 RepID=A0A9J6RE65_9BACI|nr:DUF1934 domain-containing protein [Natronobacillus azotifigens]MCZ0703636.1 DUF1934 domain-containing protein [Natronobacillus azotifigens]